MLVIHAIWTSNLEMCIWGENLTPIDDSPSKRTRESIKEKSKAHPFACRQDELREAFAQLGVETSGLLQGDIQLLLPTAKGRPIPSQSFSDENSIEPAARTLESWKIPVLTLKPSAAIDALLSLQSDTPPGLLISDSLKFFIELAKLALEIVASGRVVPTLVQQQNEFRAQWQPIFNEKYLERLSLLGRAMPPICRAEVVNDSNEGRGPEEIVHDALVQFTDAITRQSLQAANNTLVPSKPQQTKSKSSESSSVEAWLFALCSKQAIVSGNPSELTKLKKSLDGWTNEGTSAAQHSLRTCFRLSPPDEVRAEESGASKAKKSDGTWRVDFLLQATDDKSLLVPADVVWKTKGKALTFSSRKLENPQERLLEDLGRVARLYPEIEPALKTARPVALNLDANGAYRFLREAAPILEQTGYGVLVPSWWKRPMARLGVKLKTSSKASNQSNSGLLGLDGICAYQWQIAIGDQELSYEDFLKLASLKVPLVKVRGQWVELKRDEIDAALAFFEKKNLSGEMTIGDAMRLGLGLDASTTGLPVVSVEARGWMSALFGGDGEREIAQLKTPEGFNGRLRPYQERGLSWLSFLGGLGLGACLADDMGLGKTIQLLALLLAERRQSKSQASVGPTLLVCPMSVVGNWQREAEKFAPTLKVHVHHGADRLTGKQFAKTVKQSDLVITTYALATRDQKLFTEIEWARIALDEAQNIKNPSAKQTQAIRSFKAAQRVALTGTPVENRLSELWSIMEFLNPNLLGAASDFRTRFAIPIERYRDEEKAKLLKRITRPFILRRLKTDKSIIKDLPDKLEIKTFCNLTQEQASLYQAVVEDMMQKIEDSEGIERKGLVLSTLLKLKQVCNHPAHLLKDDSALAGRSGKLARLEETIEEIIAEGDRVLCFTQFAEMGHMLKSYLQERFAREVLFLHGGTQKKLRDQMVARFQHESGPPIFLLSLKAGGTGLNLTAANHVIHFDRWWNPAVENQATDRAFRIGQKKNVQVRKFVCVGTLEERIDMMIEQKKELANMTVGTGEGWITELSTAQLRELITLSSDAVSE